jgi:hypothetical protein
VASPIRMPVASVKRTRFSMREPSSCFSGFEPASVEVHLQFPVHAGRKCLSDGVVRDMTILDRDAIRRSKCSSKCLEGVCTRAAGFKGLTEPGNVCGGHSLGCLSAHVRLDISLHHLAVEDIRLRFTVGLDMFCKPEIKRRSKQIIRPVWDCLALDEKRIQLDEGFNRFGLRLASDLSIVRLAVLLVAILDLRNDG